MLMNGERQWTELSNGRGGSQCLRTKVGDMHTVLAIKGRQKVDSCACLRTQFISESCSKKISRGPTVAFPPSTMAVKVRGASITPFFLYFFAILIHSVTIGVFGDDDDECQPPSSQLPPYCRLQPQSADGLQPQAVCCVHRQFTAQDDAVTVTAQLPGQFCAEYTRVCFYSYFNFKLIKIYLKKGNLNRLKVLKF
jgi:hypothetical protein